MENPFIIIQGRLDRLEDLLLQINRSKSEIETTTKDSGGLNIAIEETGLSSHSVYRLVSERKIPHAKRGGRLYFSRKALRAWIAKGERQLSS